MKKLIFLLLLANALISSGQQYEPLVAEGKVWSNLYLNSLAGPPPYIRVTTYVKISGDTLFNGHQYKIVRVTQDSLQLNYQVAGMLREDSAHKVYYVSDTAIVPDMMYYDFGASVGDTVHLHYNDVVVTGIDSVFVFDHYRTRWLLDGGLETWIEGIGSLCGVLWSGTGVLVGGSFHLLCFYENDIRIYQNPDFNECYYLVTGTENTDNSIATVSIIPNPVTSVSAITVEGMKEKNLYLEVYNLQGTIITTTPLQADRLNQLHAADYSPGLYFYRLIGDNTRVISGKFEVR